MRILPAVPAILFLLASGAACPQQPASTQKKLSPAEAFPTSLHATRPGKNHFYSAKNGGFEKLTGVPMSQLDCTGCHAPTKADGTKIDDKTYKPDCADCHRQPGDKVADSVCLACHGRQALEAKLFTADVHRAKGMTCMSCHTTREMHGDGKRYAAQLSPGAMDAKCENCHKTQAQNTAHMVHQNSLACASCHTSSVVACNNCHFDSQLAGGGRRFNAPPMASFAFLVKREGSGKVHPATMQTLIHKDKTFVVLAPYSAHTVTPKARACGDCHANANVKTYAATGKLAVTQWDAGENRIKPITGVVPVPPDWRTALTFDFVTYTGNPADPKTDPKAWKFVKSGTDLRQMLFAQPLSKEQIEKLKTPATP